MDAVELSPGRGRRAAHPAEIPAEGWRDVALRTRRAVADDNLGILAAGIAFYWLLALFPALAALVSAWGLAFDPVQVAGQIEAAAAVLPDEAAALVRDQAHAVAGGAEARIGAAALAGLGVALYSASRGTKALIRGLNVVYGERERRRFVALNAAAFGITLALVAGLLTTLAVIVAVPVMLGHLGLDELGRFTVRWLRWPLLFVLVMVGLAALYRYAPSRSRARWIWVSRGAVVATALWVLASIAFSVYVRHFGSYNETYGSLGAVVVLLMWFWISAFIVLLGGELNAEAEHQTARDTTTGRPLPMGERGAWVADTLGPIP